MTTSPPDAARPLPAWSAQGQLLIDLALADLEGGLDVVPTMIAFRGDQPLFLAALRPFVKGGHRDPVIEVGALAMSLAADRVLLSLSGRAWSLHDPIPPVLDDGGDLRQRVIVLHQVDATGDDPMALSTIVPIDVAEDGQSPAGDEVTVRTGPALTDSFVEGWVPHALMVLVTAGRGPVDTDDLGAQVRRCELLGHRLAWSPTVMPLIELARLKGTTEDRAGEGDRRTWGLARGWAA